MVELNGKGGHRAKSRPNLWSGVTGSISEGMAVIAVGDSGCGIPQDQLQRIFEPFVQLRTTIESTDKPGVGLGLAICRDLARAMGGRMEVTSTLGVGSTFSVALPLAGNVD